MLIWLDYSVYSAHCATLTHFPLTRSFLEPCSVPDLQTLLRQNRIRHGQCCPHHQLHHSHVCASTRSAALLRREWNQVLCYDHLVCGEHLRLFVHDLEFWVDWNLSTSKAVYAISAEYTKWDGAAQEREAAKTISVWMYEVCMNFKCCAIYSCSLFITYHYIAGTCTSRAGKMVKKQWLSIFEVALM